MELCRFTGSLREGNGTKVDAPLLPHPFSVIGSIFFQGIVPRFSVTDVFVLYRFSEIGRKMKGKKMGLKIFLTCHLLANKDVK